MARTIGHERRYDSCWSLNCSVGAMVCICLMTTVVVGAFVYIALVFVDLQRNPTPDDLKMAVTDASFTDEFNITKCNNYNLDLNITLGYRNKFFHIYFGRALVVAEYRNTSALASIAGFHLPPKNTTTLPTPSLKLERDDIISTGDDSAGSDVYSILVKLYLPINKVKSVNWYLSDRRSFGDQICFTCDLKQVPLQNGSQSAPAAAFHSTKCRFHDSYNC